MHLLAGAQKNSIGLPGHIITRVSHIKTEGIFPCIAEICIGTAIAAIQQGGTWRTLRVKQKKGA